jgi:hypothetical protein
MQCLDDRVCPALATGAFTMSRFLSSLAVLSLTVAAAPASGGPVAEPPPKTEAFLTAGKLAEGERALADALKAAPDDDQLRFGLGVVQFVRAVEARMQGFYRHGYRTDLPGIGLSITNLPIATNPSPQPLDASGCRAMFQGWVDDLRKAETTLAGVKDSNVKLPLHFGLIRLDFNGDGALADDESLWQIYARFNRRPGVTPEAARELVIAFDRGDVDWLRGYCHLLMATGELILAHDFDELFRETGYLFFTGAKPSHPFLKATHARQFDFGEIADLIATIHLIRLKVVDPGRLKAVQTHLEATVGLSRSSWKAILAETDDDREWIPNPKQGTVVPGGRVSDEIVQGWFAFLDEFEAILAGKKLIPFWRGDNPHRGVNLRRVLNEPTTLDLMMWVRGSAAAPYLEEGDVTSAQTWRRITRVFRGEFIGFALWFN